MNLTFTLANHAETGHGSVLDIIMPLMAGFKELGHTIYMDDDWDREGLLVLTDHFPQSVLDRVKALQRPYAVIQSELVTGNTFNNETMFSRRYDGFMRVCEDAQFVIYLVGETNVQCPAFKAELGYTHFMEEEESIDKEFDLCFFGTHSMKRQQTMEILSDLGSKVAYCQNVSTQKRNEILRKSRWNLGMKPHWDVRFPSVTRINAALHCGTPTIYENCESDTLVGSIPLTHDGKGSFVDWVDSVVKNRRLELEEKDRQVAEFKKIPVAAQLKAGLESIKYEI